MLLDSSFLLLDSDGDNRTGAAKGCTGFGINAVEHGSTLVNTGRQIDSQLCHFDLATYGDTTRLVDDLAGVITGNLNDLRIIVDLYLH